MLIKNADIFNGTEFLKNKHIYIKNEIIEEVTDRIIHDDNIIEADNHYIVPGFIDIHTHGIMGYDLNEIDSKKMDTVSAIYNRSGTTSFLPTTVSQTTNKTINLLKYAVSNDCHKSIIGVHLEAPYINSEKKGAQNENFIRKPEVKDFLALYGKYLKKIKRVTIAPELDNHFLFSDMLSSLDILVSFGHTTCNAIKAEEAFKHGYLLATHFPNAMPSIHHRDVSITGKALLNDDVTIELIADLIHVCPDMIKLVLKMKKDDKIIIISDSISATGLNDGEYSLSGQKVIVENKTVKLEDGSLAGSLITMHEGVKNFISIGIPIEKALQYATYNPAKVLKLENKIGMIKEGNDADLLILDKCLNIKKIIVKGRQI